MAYDENHARIMAEHLAPLQGVTQKKMFGGLCFMLNGNMLCGVHKGGAMFRVGKDNEQEALRIDGISPLSFTKRPMGGMLDANTHVIEDNAKRSQIMALAIDFVGKLPQK